MRISLGQRIEDKRPLETRRAEHLEHQFQAWLDREGGR